MRRSEEIQIDQDAARVDRYLRALPPRTAPEGFEQRVLAALQRRAAQPWWRRAYREWPFLARIGLLVVCSGSMLGAWRVAGWLTAGAALGLNRVAAPLFAVRELLRAVLAADASLRLVGGGLAPHWLQGGAVVTALAYVALLGLGATAYRTLYLES